jgi:hypothetical protein
MARKRPPSDTKEPGGDGALIIRPVLMDDPFEPGTRRVVLKNVRVNPVDAMYYAGRIDDAQMAAGNLFRSYWEEAEIGGSRAIDYSRQRVDGGRMAEPLTERAAMARSQLLAAYELLGKRPYALLTAVVGEGVSCARIAIERPHLVRGLVGKRGEGYASGLVGDMLEQLVDMWGLVAMGPRRTRVTGSRETTTGPSDEWTPGRHGELVPMPPRSATTPRKKPEKG